MTIDNMRDFNKRWNIVEDSNDAFIKFKNRILISLDKVVGQIILRDRGLVDRFAFILGIQVSARSAIGPSQVSNVRRYFRGTLVYEVFSSAQTITELAEMLQALFCVLEENSSYSANNSNLFSEVQQAIDIGYSALIAIARSGEKVTLYPAGAKLLDESLVNDNLNWLKEYPDALKAFNQALTIYLRGDKPKYRNLVDNLRIAIELVLKSVLGNQKSLENQSGELDSWLKQRGVNKQIRNLYGQLLFGPYSVLQNDVAKHGDLPLLDPEIEYLIYQTGTFLRLLLQMYRIQS